MRENAHGYGIDWLHAHRDQQRHHHRDRGAEARDTLQERCKDPTQRENDEEVVAAEFGDATGEVKPEFLWAALDCPTGFAAGFPVVGTLVTGRLAVKQLEPVQVNLPCVLLSWPTGVEGRKHFSAACLYQHGEPRAVARATWIRLEA